MKLIEGLSAQELAFLISSWGFKPQVQWQIDKTARLKIGHTGCDSFIYLYGLDDHQRAKAITFTGSVQMGIQFWHIEAWSQKTLFGRLRRDDDGNAGVDWVVPIEGVTEDYLRYCFDI